MYSVSGPYLQKGPWCSNTWQPKKGRMCDLQESQSYDFTNIFADGFSSSPVYSPSSHSLWWILEEEVVWHFQPRALILEQGSGLRVTASYQSWLPHCCHSSAPSVGWAPSLRAARVASTRRCDVLKCQTASCHCQLLWPMIFIRGKQFSPPEPRISFSTQVGGDKMFASEVYYITFWSGTQHWDLLPW